MTYREAVDYLYASAPLFQHIGAGAYKEGLTNTHLLDAHFGHPHHAYKTIHVAGTNGKGSVSHSLAAILQSSGYRVGLFTSPHLVDFRERIRVNGEMITKERVVDFVECERGFFEALHPSFFELATAIAFKYFEEQRVDVAVIEVGLGGRLDCTNIITPILSVITNISLDHVQFLGSTVDAIAAEKAGIMKSGVTTVVGECVEQPPVREVFERHAKEVGAGLVLAELEPSATMHETGDIDFQLKGDCQHRNIRTIGCAVRHLPLTVSEEAVREGLRHVCDLTGLMGRWQTTETCPRVICDTGHNVGGWEYLSRQLSAINGLHMVVGMVGDKDVDHVLMLMPRHARYYFTAASVQRAMPAAEFAVRARAAALQGDVYPDVATALEAAKKNACPDDTIFIGGSTFIVADYLSRALT